MNWYMMPWQKFAKFDGRACRAEYWTFTLINIVIAMVISFVEGMVGSPGILGILFTIAIVVPSIAVGVRRLHDIGFSGWLILIGLVPLLGGLALLVMFVLPGKPAGDKYGPDPLNLLLLQNYLCFSCRLGRGAERPRNPTSS
jgi:uncharacterized membrane protein YhaH (DUF805 family)